MNIKAVEEIRKKMMSRMDADEENENEVQSGKKSTALATRLPYGIARDMGINTEGLTPREVWDKISGEGVSPKAAMSAKLSAPADRVSVSSMKQKKLPKISTDNFPSFLTNTPTNKKETQILCDKINSAPGSNSDAGELFRGMGALNEKCQCDAVKNATRRTVQEGHGQAFYRFRKSTGEMLECAVKVPKVVDDDTTKTATHELGHYLDALCGDGTRDGYNSTSKNKELHNAISDEVIYGEKDISEKAWNLMSDLSKKERQARSAETVKVSMELDECNQKWHKGLYHSYNEYNKEYNRIKREGRKRISAKGYEELKGHGQLMDMYDAMSRGRFMSHGLISHGHGATYYADPTSVSTELFANYCSLSIHAPDLLKIFENDFPKTSAQLRAHVQEMLKRIK